MFHTKEEPRFMQSCTGVEILRVKKKWLRFSIIYIGLYFFVDVWCFLRFPAEDGLFASLGSIVQFLILYYSAYKKAGTRLLKAIIFLKFGVLSRSLWLITTIPAQEVFPYALGIAEVILLLYWIFLDLKLVRINKSLQQFKKNL